MPSPTIHFNTLPLSARQHLTEALAERGPCPALMAKRVSHLQQTGTGLGGVVAGLGMLVGLLATSAGELSPEGHLYDGWRLLGYGMGFALLAGGALALVREIRAHRARHGCAAPDGTYVFPGRILDLRDGWITSQDLAALIRLEITNHSTNGLHTHTSFDFRFGEELGDPRVKLHYGKQWEAAEALQRWEAGRKAFLARVAGGESVGDLDPLAGVDLGSGMEPKPAARLEGPRVPDPMPPLFRPLARRGLRLNLALAGGAVACGLLVWGVDSAVGDARVFRALRYQDQASAYRLYAERGLLHRGEVRNRLLPAALLREALNSGKVQPLRAFLREFPTYPDVPQARQALNVLFDQAQARWQAQTEGIPPKAWVCLVALLQVMRQPEHEAIRVVFARPEAKALETLDQTLGAVRTTPAEHMFATLNRDTPAPVEALALHFTPEACAQRENELVGQLQAGFAKVFQGDLLVLEKGEPGHGPCLRIDYRIDPTETRFSGSGGRVQYVGIRFTFEVRIDLPGQPEAYRFPLVVEPTDQFNVAYTRKAPAGTPTSFLKIPTGGEVYDAMATRALEQVGEKVRQVFLSAGEAP